MEKFGHRYSLLPPVIKILLISNCVVYFLEPVYTGFLVGNFALWPVAPDALIQGVQQEYEFRLWQLVSYSFLHANLFHLVLNMYALWLFGSEMENLWGSRVFAIYYTVCVIGAGLTQTVVASQTGALHPTVGASGGVFGLLLAFGLFFPNRLLLLVFPPVPIRAKWFVLIYGVIELVFGVTGTESGVAHFAHLGGMLFGFLLILYWSRHPPKAR